MTAFRMGAVLALCGALVACDQADEGEVINLDLSNVEPWVEASFEVTDAVAHSGGTELLITETSRQTVRHIDGVTGEELGSWAVPGTPDRLAYDAGRQQVAVVHGYESRTVLSLLDLSSGQVTEVDLGTYGIHANYAADGLLYVLTRPSARGYVVVVDPGAGTVLNTYELGNSGWIYEIGVTDDSVITGSIVHDKTPVEDKLPTRYVTEGSFAFNPHIAAISPDGLHMLYSSRLTSSLDSHLVADGTRNVEYYLGEDGGGPEDYGYSLDGSSVYVLTTDFRQHYFRIFDTASGDFTGQVNVVVPEAFDTVIFDKRFYTLSADGERAWVVLTKDQKSVLSWVPITLAEGL